MRRARAFILVAVLVIVSTGCTTEGNDPTTTTSISSTTSTTVAQTTTSSTSTTTTAPTSTTVASNDPWSIDYPLDAETVDDLPAVLADKIDAPEPDPDLTIEGPDDIDRWVNEWLDWFSWVSANPEEGVVALEHAVIPASTFYADTLAALEADRDAGTALLGYAFKPVEVSGTFDEFFERRELLRVVVVAADEIPGYVIDRAGAVISVIEPLDGEATIRLLLRYRQEDEEWVLENLEVLG